MCIVRILLDFFSIIQNGRKFFSIAKFEVNKVMDILKPK